MPTDGHWDSIRAASYPPAYPSTAAQQPCSTANGPDLSETDSLPDLVPPSPTLDEVDIILAVKLRRTPLHRRLDNLYLVQWVGCGPAEATWEPASNLWGAWEAVIEAHAFFGLDPPEFPYPQP
jgi:hypothetical protein